MSVFNSKKNYFIFYIIIFIGALTVKGRNVTSEKSVLTKVFEKFHKFVHLSENFHRFPMKYPHPAYERLPKVSKHQGPVVQSIVSLMSSLRGQLVKCFMTL